MFCCEAFEFPARHVLQNLLHGEFTDWTGCCSCGRKEGVENALLPILNPDLATEAGGRPLMHRNGVPVGIRTLAPACRKVLVEIFAKYCDRPVHHYAAQRIVEDPVDGAWGIRRPFEGVSLRGRLVTRDGGFLLGAGLGMGGM